MSFWVCIYYWTCLIKIEAFCTKNEDFDQTYLNTGSKTQTVGDLSLDLIFHNNFCYKIKSFSKQNSRIHSKLDRNQSQLTVCSSSQKYKVSNTKTWKHCCNNKAELCALFWQKRSLLSNNNIWKEEHCLEWSSAKLFVTGWYHKN